jgi:mRNA-degrading endonuclease RelE of RelBE toxin-antitoxin system
MYRWAIEADFKKELDRLRKKSKTLFEQVYKKIIQIAQNPELGKPLSNTLCGKKRVHAGSFVLIFKVDVANEIVTFLYLEHHDKAYL